MFYDFALALLTDEGRMFFFKSVLMMLLLKLISYHFILLCYSRWEL